MATIGSPDPVGEVELFCCEILTGVYDAIKRRPYAFENPLQEALDIPRDFPQTRRLAKLTTDLCSLLLITTYPDANYAQISAYNALKVWKKHRALSGVFDESLDQFKDRLVEIEGMLTAAKDMCLDSFTGDANNFLKSLSPFVALDVDPPVLCFNNKKRTGSTQQKSSRKVLITESATVKSGSVQNDTVTTSSSTPILTRELPLSRLEKLFEDFKLQLVGHHRKQNNMFEVKMLDQSNRLEQATSEIATQSNYISMMKAAFDVVREMSNFDVTQDNGDTGQNQDFLISKTMNDEGRNLVCGEVKKSIGDNISSYCCDHDKCPYVQWSEEFHNLFVDLVTNEASKTCTKNCVIKYIQQNLTKISDSSIELGKTLQAMFCEDVKNMSSIAKKAQDDLKKAIASDFCSKGSDNISTVKLDKWLQGIFTRPCNIEGRAGDRHSTRSLTSQMFGYMVAKNVHFGIMTDYDRTAFCITDCTGRMFISPCLTKSTNEFYRVPQAIVMFCMLAASCTGAGGIEKFRKVGEVLVEDGDVRFNTSREVPSRRCNRIPKNGAPIKEATGYSPSTNSTNQATSIKSVKFGDPVGHGRTGDAHIAEYDGASGVLKMVDKLKNPTMQDEISWEIYVYERLKKLQGRVVPKILRAGTFKEWYIDGILTENMGKSLAQFRKTCENIDFNRLLKEAEKALAKVHGAGFLHGDIKAENIVLDQKMNPFLIDFGNARELPTDTKDAALQKQLEFSALRDSILNCEEIY